MTKPCSKCEVVKPAGGFYKHTTPDRPKGSLSSWCRECISSYRKKERQERKEYYRVRSASEKAEKIGVENTLTLEEWLEVLASYGAECSYCFGPYEVMEHVVSLSHGGSNSKKNVVPACATCNSAKRYVEWCPPTILSPLWARFATNRDNLAPLNDRRTLAWEDGWVKSRRFGTGNERTRV